VLVALVSLSGLLTSLMLLSRDATLTARVIERQVVARVTEASVFARLKAALADQADVFETTLLPPAPRSTVSFPATRSRCRSSAKAARLIHA